jgi:hypothetical protein
MGAPTSSLDNHGAGLALSEETKREIVEKKVTCPFLGSAVAQNFLAVKGEATNPLASIEDVRKLGNTGGGDLGDILVVFASGNHAFMRGDTGRLDKHTPPGLFSLELPASQGSHPGHSGILQGDPKALDSGRLSNSDFERLASRAKDGFIKRSDVGEFIAENLVMDNASKVFDRNVATLLARDVGETIGTAALPVFAKLFGSNSADVDHGDFETNLTKLLGENNLIGSAGEFGLLFAFLGRKPDALEIDGEPAVSLEDVRGMFVDKSLPEGWQGWGKHRIDWVGHTTALLFAAAKQYRALKRT